VALISSLIPVETTLKYYNESCMLAAFYLLSKLSNKFLKPLLGTTAWD